MNLQYAELGRSQAPSNKSTPHAAQQRLQIRHELDSLDSNINNLNLQLDMLVERMKPVMVPRGSGKTGEASCPPQPVRCDVADELHRRNEAIEGIGIRINDMLSSLEI